MSQTADSAKVQLWQVVCLSLALGAGGCSVVVNGVLAESADAGTLADAVSADRTVQDVGVDAPMARDAAPHDAGSDVTGDAPSPTCPSPPDCTNPACKAHGFVCVPQPDAWVIAAVEIGGASACPSGYDAAPSLIEVRDASPATCGCVCGLTEAPSCTTGNVLVNYGTGGNCGSASVLSAADGGCVQRSLAIYPDFQLAALPSPVGGACTAKTTTTLPDASVASVSICTPSAPLTQGGCQAGEVCTSTTPSREKCVVGAGSTPCPASYANGHAVGAGLADTRGCGECTCGKPTGTCANPTLTYFPTSGCTGSETYSVNLDGQCHPTAADAGAFVAYVFGADAAVDCGAPTAAPAPTGAVTATSPDTLCCQ